MAVVQQKEDAMKNKIGKIIASIMIVFIVFFLFADFKIIGSWYVKALCVDICLPGGISIRVDPEINRDTGVSICKDYHWLDKNKLCQDFISATDTYIVLTSERTVKLWGNNTLGVLGGSNNTIWIKNLYETTILHELAHYADYTHDNLSQNERWQYIYQNEWSDNKWLETYKDKDKAKEAFAEGFAQWYYLKYNDDFKNENNLCWITNASNCGFLKENYPLTCEFMEDFYDNYEFINDGAESIWLQVNESDSELF